MQSWPASTVGKPLASHQLYIVCIYYINLYLTATLLFDTFILKNNPSDSPNSIRRPATLTARNFFAIAAFVDVVQQLRRDLAGPQRVISCCFA